ncbi:MAG: ABC transporter permease [Candidatus Aureabacteria bacterium]|nr:ABC transporter permease [Candidatus Auribacterota bacterium]MCK5160278.1 ABC transporter permease [Candidatus Auribacterota bacterium]MCK5654905.1 ABC transporter permease [Candidatus Auribacterota bacterium]
MREQGYYRQVWKKFKKNRLAMTGFYTAVIMGFIAVAAPVIANNRPIIARTRSGEVIFPFLNTGMGYKDRDYTFEINPLIPYSPSEYDLDSVLIAPSVKHFFGTDDRGRDVASRLVYGARISLSIGFVAVSIYVFIGLVLGSVAGYFGRKVDIVISRLIEIMICFPTFFLIITIIAYLPSSIYNIMIVIGITGWTGVARLIRGEIFKIKNIDYVYSARALGVSADRIIFKHILPNAIGPVLVSATFGIAGAILVESSLSFLGFGVQPPTPSWGEILFQAKQYLSWWLVIFPGLAIFITITSFNLVGEGLRDAIDPKFSK